MTKNSINTQSSTKTVHNEDFEFMGDSPQEDPHIAERRRARENEITKKLGEYLLKGYCMLGDTCSDCNCILLRTPDRQLFCVGCNEIDFDSKKVETTTTTNKKKKKSKKSKNKNEQDDSKNNSHQLEDKLKWAVDELTKSQNPNRINEMCSVIIKLTEAIKALKHYEMTSVEN